MVANLHLAARLGESPRLHGDHLSPGISLGDPLPSCPERLAPTPQLPATPACGGLSGRPRRR
jgi:hypothetical protein